MTDLLNTKEVAELLEISQGRVRQIAQRGYLKASHVGRDWVFRRNDVEIFRDSPKRRAGRRAILDCWRKQWKKRTCGAIVPLAKMRL
jgi:excisionase family DNA binding protein